ncbi:hypothetical protein [Shewanella insulae]|uniref:hypothetical protein n=1 Tax=Shewanella insulae TaxID=2681496 RepID=UPI00248139EE|nr:hypothetical protein [Shewanella insulae]
MAVHQYMEGGPTPDYDIMDAPLNCNEDPDFTCEDWDKTIQTARLLNYLNNLDGFQMVVDQSLLDTNYRIKMFVANSILAVPSARMVAIITTLGKDLAMRLILQSVITATFADVIGEALNQDSLEIGDIIVISGNGEVSIIKAGAPGSSNDDTESTGTGGGSSGGTTGSGGALVGGATNGSNTGTGSRRVCTGTQDNMRCFTVYY